MDGQTTLAALLAKHMEERGYRRERLAREAEVSAATVQRWFHREIAAPYQREHMLKVAATLGLTRAQTNRLLRAAGLPSLDRLAAGVSDVRADLFAPWQVAGRHNLSAGLTSFVGRDD